MFNELTDNTGLIANIGEMSLVFSSPESFPMARLRLLNPRMTGKECALIFTSNSEPRESKVVLLPDVNSAQKLANSTVWLYMSQFTEKNIFTTTDILIFEKKIDDNGELVDGDVLIPTIITLEEMKTLFKFHLPFRVYINSPEVFEIYSEALLRNKLVPNLASLYFSPEMSDACRTLVKNNQIEILEEISL